MRKPSTAKFIPYNLRPAKQVERRILLDFLKCANASTIPASQLRYVGMGGTMFYDFHLVHRFLGMGTMVSLERDQDIFPRSQFNRPFHFIDVRNDTVAQFLASDRDERITIYWLDYDDGLSQDIVGDIISLGTRLKIGGCAFVTVYAEPPGVLQRLNSERRLDWFLDNFPAFSGQVSREDMENHKFPATVYQVLMATFKQAFSARGNGLFHPYFRVTYKDSASMITVGGYFCTKTDGLQFKIRLRADLPFLLRRDPFQIKRLNLTDKERALFDVAVTKPKRTSSEAVQLRSIGFEKNDMDAYSELIRFLPRYQESII